MPRKPTGRPTGRPKKEIDQRQFEQLCQIQCTETEICGWFGVSDKTLTRWCKETYFNEYGEGMSFSEVFAEKRSAGKISLRRFQFQQAEKSPAMAIWLGKQYLGQVEKAVVATKEIEDDPLTTAFRALENFDELSFEE